MSRIDWPAIMRAGFYGLGLKPSELWDLTPAELLFMLGMQGDTKPLTRENLAELSARFPDTPESKEKT